MNETRQFIKLWSLACLVLGGCIHLDFEDKDRCVRQDDCIGGFVCQAGLCAPPGEDHVPAEDAGERTDGALGDGDSLRGDGDGDAHDAGNDSATPDTRDTLAPEAPQLPESGNYNLKTGFSCAKVSGVEANASVFYTMTTDGSEPPDPDEHSPESDLQEEEPRVCGIPSNGTVRIKVRQVDLAGNYSEVASYQYQVDRSAPYVPTIPESGPQVYAGLNCFTIASVPGLDSGLTFFYEYTTDGSDPKVPDPATSPAVEASASNAAEVCGVLTQNGVTKVKAIAVDGAGNVSIGNVRPWVYAEIHLDSVQPAVLSVKHLSNGPVYAGQRVVFELQASESEGVASVVFGEREVLLEEKAPDNVRRGSYLVRQGDNLVGGKLTGKFADLADNRAFLVSGQTLSLDGIGADHSGEIIKKDTLWKAVDNPHFIRDDSALVMAGFKLTVEPGVYILFGNDESTDSGLKLVAQDPLLIMVGTAEAPIVVAGGGEIVVRGGTQAAYDNQGNYVTGGHFEHVVAKRATLSVSAPASGLASVYVKRCEFATWGSLSLSQYRELSGAYVGYSKFDDFGGNPEFRLASSLLEHNVMSHLEVELSQAKVRHCDIGTLVLNFGTITDGGEVEFNDINALRVESRYSNAVHDNHIGGIALIGTIAGTFGPFDARRNYWGAAGTSEIAAKGADANLSFVSDVYDNQDVSLVDYSDWLLTPIVGVGADWN